MLLSTTLTGPIRKRSSYACRQDVQPLWTESTSGTLLAGATLPDKASADGQFSHNVIPLGSANSLRLQIRRSNLGYAHPAISEPQHTTWLLRDTLGLAEDKQRACQEASVGASVGPNASMDEKGKVDVIGFPPESKALDVDA